MPLTLIEEAQRATGMLAGRTVSLVRRHRLGEVVMEFTDGTRFFVDASTGTLELSITGEFPDED